MRMLLYVVSTAGEFVCNEGSVVQLPAPSITMCDFLTHTLLCIHYLGLMTIFSSNSIKMVGNIKVQLELWNISHLTA